MSLESNNYGILRIEKIKKTSKSALYGRVKHVLREFGNGEKNDILKDKFDPNLSENNIYFGCLRSAEFREFLEDRWKLCTGKIRKDAVGCLEVVVTTSKDAVAPENQKDFFIKALKQINSWYGSENVLMATVHMDETTPHMHVFVVPLETKKVQKNRLTAEEKARGEPVWVEKTSLSVQKIMGNRKLMSDLQTSFYEAVFKPFGLARGKLGSRAKNERPSLQKMVRELKKREAALSALSKKLTEKEEAVESKLRELNNTFSQIQGMANWINKKLNEGWQAVTKKELLDFDANLKIALERAGVAKPGTNLNRPVKKNLDFNRDM